MPESSEEEQTLHAAEVGGCVNPTAFHLSVLAEGEYQISGIILSSSQRTPKRFEVDPLSAEVDLLYRATQKLLKHHLKANQLICLYCFSTVLTLQSETHTLVLKLSGDIQRHHGNSTVLKN